MNNINKKQINIKKILIIILSILLLQNIITITIQATQTPGVIYEDTLHIEYRNITVYAPAVGQTSQGYVGVISTITVTIQSNGSGRVFVDTLPLAQIDMQGSARLAVKVASSIVKADDTSMLNPDEYDYFFVIRTSAPIIGGPSGGGILTVAVISLLQEWDMDEQTVMTGMINPDASIGPVGGIIRKIDAAASVGARRFLIPYGQDTYTETVYETVQTQWGTQIVTQQVTRSVYEYAQDNYGMEVIEVEDIYDVILYYTGNEIQQLESSESISTEQYIDSMKPLATTLLTNAEQTLQNATETFHVTSIPNQFPTYYRNRVTDHLNTANDAFTSSQNWFEKGTYYTSTSKSFQSLINTNFVLLACNYFSSEDPEEFLQETLRAAKESYKNQSGNAKNATINGAITLQCVGAAQKRATDAGDYLSSAEKSIRDNEAFTALYQIAFANQRTESIGWWLGLSHNFNDTGNFSDAALDRLSNEYIQDAQQAITYTGVILKEIGRSSNLLASAQTMLDSAKKDYDNQYYAAALFEALEALSKANLALELVNLDSQDQIQQKINRANESANAGISESRAIGIEPILAVSYYEFAESLIEEDSVENALFYYKYSYLITGVLRLSGEYGDRSSRFVGIPPVQTRSLRLNISNIGGVFLTLLTFGIIGGIIIGVLVGLLFSYPKKKRTSPPSPKQERIYQEYDVYPSKYQESPLQAEHYSYDTLPHTIHDFYKKQK